MLSKLAALRVSLLGRADRARRIAEQMTIAKLVGAVSRARPLAANEFSVNWRKALAHREDFALPTRSLAVMSSQKASQ